MGRIMQRANPAAVFLAALLAFGSLPAADAPRGPSKDAVQKYERYARAARAESLRPDQCPFSPAAVVMQVGIDPEALAAFVRANIAYEPYRGIVRGSAGVLAAGSGGDWDRAELLRALLSAAGHEAKFVVIERTPAEAAAVVGGFFGEDPRRRTLPAGGEVDLAKLPPPPPLLRRFGIPEENRAIHLRRGAAQWRRLLDEAFDAAAPEAVRIERSVAAAGLAAWNDLAAWKKTLAAGAAERVLVEIEVEDAARVLSPGPEASAPDAARLDATERLDAPPPELVARAGVRLTLVTGAEGQEGAATILVDWTHALGELVDRPLRLEIVPVDSKAAARPPAQWTPEEWYERVRGFRQFQAIFRAGDDWMGSKVFDLDGGVHDVAADGRVESAKQLGAAARGLGGLFGGESEPEAKTGIRELVLSLEVVLPGEEPASQERLIYGDLRRDVSPVYIADMLVCPGPLGPATAAWLALDAVTANAPILARALLSEDARRFDDGPDARRCPSMLHDWQLGRLALADRILRAERALSFLGGPAAVLQTSQFVVKAETKTAGVRVALDVAFDRAQMLPRAAEGVASAPRANMTLGAASTVLESAILRRHRPDAMARGAYPEAQRARLEGLAPVAAQRGENGAVTGARPDPLGAWAIARNETGGALLFPRRDGAASWWSVDRATGATLGRGGAGEGQSAIEYLQITKMNLSNLKCMLAWQSAMMFGNQRDPKAAVAWMACITGVDNPGGPMGAAGNTLSVMGWETTGGVLGSIGDILGGALDVGDMVEGSDE
ncbi:MAG TPA: hypothetical protein PKX48_10620 [Planctomycetota bacterium]|nr:hypothetical protein [Planctomycetota bacterium]OQC21069.1 MAG: hypothetical protein BWX69_01265 [Planctomycetes bacterium ADurb.Bin069]HNS00183.1 hypothetical protein [Planctomycetota bacterium]HNU26688.1 hypothetical protein [Planctomycetota bacterium]HOE30364.1 hypothetical protein [Planctomycetota bacterium]